MSTYISLLLPLGLAIPAIAIGLIGAKGLDAISRQPEVASKLQLNMILAIAFAEGLGVLTFVLILIMINK